VIRIQHVQCCASSPCFFSYRLGYHRALHSFPTRRSSDLTWRRECSASPRSSRWTSTGWDGWSASPRRKAAPLAPASSSGSAVSRSEEHTSELQSRENLVCRLLLEKKKEQTTQQTGETTTA